MLAGFALGVLVCLAAQSGVRVMVTGLAQQAWFALFDPQPKRGQ